MKTEPVSLLLGVCVLLLSGPTVSAVSLDVRPNRQQFFTGDSVSLSCVDDQPTGGWTVKKIREGQTDQCGSRGFGVFNGSSCSIFPLSQSDSGFYWCRTSSGQMSLPVNIDVTGGDLILEIPARPVVTGSDVTLRCRDKGWKIVEAYFYRHTTGFGPRPVREFKISGVQRSDDDVYWCSTDHVGKSPKGWLRVRDPSSPPTSPPPLLSLVRLFVHLLVFCPFFVSTGLMLSIYCSRDKRDKAVVSMEMEHSVGRVQGLDEEYDDVTADVTTVYEF